MIGSLMKHLFCQMMMQENIIMANTEIEINNNVLILSKFNDNSSFSP